MSRCRCGEISNLEARVNKLNAASARCHKYSLHTSALSTDLSSCSAKLYELTESDNITDCQDKIKKLSDSLSSRCGSMKAQIDGKIASHNANLSAMRAEDRQYHIEEEARRLAAQREAERIAREKEEARRKLLMYQEIM